MQTILIVAAFSAIVTVATLRYPLFLGLFLGSALLYLSGGSLSGFGALALESATDLQTIELALSVALITLLASVLDTTGIMTRMTDGLNGVVRSPRANLMAAPALMAALPIVGGAAMSAPVVQEMGDRIGVSRPTLAAINLNYRHVGHLLMPFRPDMILAASLTGMSVFRLVLLNATAFVVWFTVGYLRLFRNVRNVAPPERGNKKRELGQFLLYGSPILTPIVLSGALGWPLPPSLLVGTAMAIVLGTRDGKLTWGWKHWMGRVNGTLVLTMVAIMLFRSTVGEIGVLSDWMVGLVERGIPLWVTAAVAVGTISFLSSNTQPGLAVVLPVVIPLLPPDSVRAYAQLIYVTGAILYLVSPLHLCQILTNQMMKVRPGDVYREYLPVAAAVLAAALVVFFVLV